MFLFIGDGMSYPQFQSAADYLGAMADSDYMQAVPSLDDNQGAVLDGPVALNFMGFETVGSVVTYDSNSFAPRLRLHRHLYLHRPQDLLRLHQRGRDRHRLLRDYHRKGPRPAGHEGRRHLLRKPEPRHPRRLYAHQASRGSYYEIGEELVASGFEYFAGGGLLKPTGSDGKREDLYALAEKSGLRWSRPRPRRRRSPPAL